MNMLYGNGRSTYAVTAKQDEIWVLSDDKLGKSSTAQVRQLGISLVRGYYTVNTLRPTRLQQK